MWLYAGTIVESLLTVGYIETVLQAPTNLASIELGGESVPAGMQIYTPDDCWVPRNL